MKVKRMSGEESDRIVEEWHGIWITEAKEKGEYNPEGFISMDYLKQEARRSAHCAECGMPCGSHGWNSKGEIQCLYCGAEETVKDKQPWLYPMPTHGVPFYIYVAKHRAFCRQAGNCSECNAHKICVRLDAKEKTLFDFST